MKIRVYYEDTDMGGVVYHSNYLNFCERARSEAFFKQGLTPVLDKGHFVVKKLNANYILSAKLGDLLEVKTEILAIKAASFTMLQSIYKDDVKIFEMELLLAYVSFEGKAQRLEKSSLELLRSFYTIKNREDANSRCDF